MVPAFVAFCTGIIVMRLSKDYPKGYYTDLKKSGEMPEVLVAALSCYFYLCKSCELM